MLVIDQITVAATIVRDLIKVDGHTTARPKVLSLFVETSEQKNVSNLNSLKRF